MKITIKTLVIIAFALYIPLSVSLDFDKAIEKSKTHPGGNINITGDANKASALAQDSITQFRNSDDERYTVQKHPATIFETNINPSGSLDHTIDCGFTYARTIIVTEMPDGNSFYSGGSRYSSIADAIRHNCLN